MPGISGRWGVRGSGLSLSLGLLSLGFGPQTQVKEVSGHGERVSQVQDTVAGGPGFQWKCRHEVGAKV